MKAFRLRSQGAVSVRAAELNEQLSSGFMTQGRLNPGISMIVITIHLLLVTKDSKTKENI